MSEIFRAINVFSKRKFEYLPERYESSVSVENMEGFFSEIAILSSLIKDQLQTEVVNELEKIKVDSGLNNNIDNLIYLDVNVLLEYLGIKEYGIHSILNKGKKFYEVYDNDARKWIVNTLVNRYSAFYGLALSSRSSFQAVYSKFREFQLEDLKQQSKALAEELDKRKQD